MQAFSFPFLPVIRMQKAKIASFNEKLAFRLECGSATAGLGQSRDSLSRIRNGRDYQFF